MVKITLSLIPGSVGRKVMVGWKAPLATVTALVISEIAESSLFVTERVMSYVVSGLRDSAGIVQTMAAGQPV